MKFIFKIEQFSCCLRAVLISSHIAKRPIAVHINNPGMGALAIVEDFDATWPIFVTVSGQKRPFFERTKLRFI